jgi:hypothetical protein
MVCRVAVVRTDVLEEGMASIFRVSRIGELLSRGGLLVADIIPNSPILDTLMLETILPSETSVLTRAIRRNIPEDGFLLVVPVFH